VTMERIVIGVGNRDRGDDAAGIAVAERVTGTISHVVPTGAMDLYELWTAHDSVVIIDAMRSDAAVGTVRRFDVSATPLPSETFPHEYRGHRHRSGRPRGWFRNVGTC